MWAGRVRRVSPGTAGERESSKGSLDPFPVVAEVLAGVDPSSARPRRPPAAHAD